MPEADLMTTEGARLVQEARRQVAARRLGRCACLVASQASTAAALYQVALNQGAPSITALLALQQPGTNERKCSALAQKA